HAAPSSCRRRGRRNTPPEVDRDTVGGRSARPGSDGHRARDHRVRQGTDGAVQEADCSHLRRRTAQKRRGEGASSQPARAVCRAGRGGDAMTVGAVVDPATGQRRYDVEVPGNLVDLLASTVVRTPDSPAFVDAHVSVTWREFAELVEAAARGLADLGIAAGDRVGLLAGNSVPLTSAYWAIWRLGAIAVPLNHRLTSTELAAQLVDSGTRICLIGRDREELGAAATAEAGATAVVQHSESSLVDGTSGLGPTALDR